MAVRRLWFAPPAISVYAYWTDFVVPVFTAPVWFVYSRVSCPRPLYCRRICVAGVPPVTAEKVLNVYDRPAESNAYSRRRTAPSTPLPSVVAASTTSRPSGSYV